MRVPVPVCRLLYRLAWQALRVWWLLAHPHVRGVKCVLTSGEDVLLVRHTYGHRDWDLPGGKLHRHEDPRAGASREMAEELGVSDVGWESLGTFAVRIDGRQDEMHLFRGEIGRQPLTIDACELAEVRWFPRAALPRPLGRHVAEIVARGKFDETLTKAQPSERIDELQSRTGRGQGA